MKIPKIISKKNREYILVKEYKNYALYKDMITGVNECFTRHELGLAEEMIKPPKVYLNLIGGVRGKRYKI